MDATARRHVAAQILPKAQQKFLEAKANEDPSANLIRQQIWLLKDMASGVQTKMAVSEQKAILKDWLPYFGLKSSQSTQKADEPDAAEIAAQAAARAATHASGDATPAPADAAAAESPTAGLTSGERRLRTLQKKLAQIQALKDRQSEGEKLEKNQMEKLETEDEIQAEIRDVERLIEAASAPLEKTQIPDGSSAAENGSGDLATNLATDSNPDLATQAVSEQSESDTRDMEEQMEKLDTKEDRQAEIQEVDRLIEAASTPLPS